MNTITKLYFNMLTGGILLLSSMVFVSPAHAEFGIDAFELSPARILTTGNSTEYQTLSGTVVFSLPKPNTEIALPFLWSKNDDSFIFDQYRAFTVDLQWRKFDNPKRTGPYAGLLMRVFNGKTDNPLAEAESETDIGIGAVAGFRKTFGNFYYGANMSLAVFPEEISNVNFGEHDFFRNQLSWTADFLKIGYRF